MSLSVLVTFSSAIDGTLLLEPVGLVEQGNIFTPGDLRDHFGSLPEVL